MKLSRLSHFSPLSILSVLCLLSACASCRPNTNSLLVCLVEAPPDLSNCNKGKVHTTPLFPDQFSDYVSISEEALTLFVARKQECIDSPDHTLPAEYDTIREMNPCVINPVNPVNPTMQTCINHLVPDNFAVDKASWNKIVLFLQYCKDGG